MTSPHINMFGHGRLGDQWVNSDKYAGGVTIGLPRQQPPKHQQRIVIGTRKTPKSPKFYNINVDPHDELVRAITAVREVGGGSVWVSAHFSDAVALLVNSIHEFRAPPAQKITRSNRDLIGKWISRETLEFIARYLKTDSGVELISDDLPGLAIKAERAVSALLNTIADSIRSPGKVSHFRLSTRGDFTDPVARALIFRLPVSFREEYPFTSSIHSDLANAIASGTYKPSHFHVQLDNTNSLVLHAPAASLLRAPRQDGDNWTQARAGRFKKPESE